MLIFGMGYTTSRLGALLIADGWKVTSIGRSSGERQLAIDDPQAVLSCVASATHILSSIPPSADIGDIALARYGDALARADASWTGYLSSTGVYGDTHGAWVDESAPVGAGRRSVRSEADLAWQRLREDVHVFRLPGIYGPGRSALDRVRNGKAHRIDLPGQIFSRVHVDDIVSAVRASLTCRPGVYNIADDLPCSQNMVIEHACAILGCDLPPLQTIAEAGLAPMAQGFYTESRRVSNQKAKRILKWRPTYSSYKQGLAAISVAEGKNPD